MSDVKNTFTPEELANALRILQASPAATAAPSASWTDQARNASGRSKTPATRVKAKPTSTAAPKTLDEALARIAALESGQHTISLRVSEKGAVSVYGLGRFPVTLYKSQMTALLDSADAIRSFMAANAAKLTTRE